MKRKTLTLTLSLLVCFALIGVGYAAWVITNTNTAELEGNIVIDSVEDKRLNVSYIWVDADGGELTLPENATSPTLAYGIKTGVENAPEWLANDDNTENLSAYLKVTVKDSNNNLVDATVEAVLSTYGNNAKWDAAVTSGLVGALPTAQIEKKGVGEYLISFTLTWGSKFNGQNPAELFADMSLDDDLPPALEDSTYTKCGDYAAHYLSELEKAFMTNSTKDVVTYKLSVTVSAE